MKDCGSILVVDSDDASRLTAVQVAVRLGYDARPTPTGEELLERLGHDRPALAIVEVELPGHANGLEVMRQLHDEFGARPSRHSRLGRANRCIRPRGRPHARSRRLPPEATRRRRAPRADQALAAALCTRTPNGNGHGHESSLSPRERQILALLAEGRTQGQIASALVISPKTVATHIQHILSKLGVQSRAQAVAVAFQRGLVEPEVHAHLLALTASE